VSAFCRAGMQRFPANVSSSAPTMTTWDLATASLAPSLIGQITTVRDDNASEPRAVLELAGGFAHSSALPRTRWYS